MKLDELLNLKSRSRYIIKLSDEEKKIITQCLESYLDSPKIGFTVHNFLSQLMPERYGVE